MCEEGGGGVGGSKGELGRGKLFRSGDLIGGAGANSDLKTNAREVKHAADVYSKVLQLRKLTYADVC